MTGDMRIDSRLDSAGIISEAARTSQELGGKTGRPKGVVMIHFNILKNVHHFNYWKPYREGGVYLHAAAIFDIADFPAIFAAPAFGARQVEVPRFAASYFCAAVQKERTNYTVLVPTMINLLTQFADVKSHDLSSLE